MCRPDFSFFGLVPVAVILVTVGCHAPSPPPPAPAAVNRIEFPAEVRTRTLLVSEIAAAADPNSLIDCPIVISNHTSGDQQVTLLGTGCSCYGATVNGEQLEANVPVSLAKEGSLRFNVQTHLAAQEDEREFVVTLLTTQPDQTTSQGDITCRLQIFQDVRMVPGVLTVKGRSHAPINETRPVTLEHVYRSPDPREVNFAPVTMPQGMRLEVLASAGPAKKLEEDLWQQQWNATLRIDLPADAVLPSPVQMLEMVAEGKDIPPQRGTAQVVVEVTRPITFPSSIHFGAIPAGTPRNRRILISSSDKQAFELSLASTPLPAGLEVQVPRESQPRHWLDITLTPIQAGEFHEKLHLKTSLAEEPEITIDVEASILPPSEPGR